MLSDSLRFIIESLGHFFIFALLLRFILQWVRAPFQHPLARFSIALTDFIVRPLRRIIPGWHGYDLATLFAAWACASLVRLLVFLMLPIPLMGATIWLLALGLGLIDLFTLSIYLLIIAVLAYAVLSWVSPYNLLSPLLERIILPLLQPIRRILPLIGGIDLSPLILLLILQLILKIPVVILEQSLYSLVGFLATP